MIRRILKLNFINFQYSFSFLVAVKAKMENFFYMNFRGQLALQMLFLQWRIILVWHFSVPSLFLFSFHSRHSWDWDTVNFCEWVQTVLGGDRILVPILKYKACVDQTFRLQVEVFRVFSVTCQLSCLCWKCCILSVKLTEITVSFRCSGENLATDVKNQSGSLERSAERRKSTVSSFFQQRIWDLE